MSIVKWHFLKGHRHMLVPCRQTLRVESSLWWFGYLCLDGTNFQLQKPILYAGFGNINILICREITASRWFYTEPLSGYWTKISPLMQLRGNWAYILSGLSPSLRTKQISLIFLGRLPL